MTKEEFKNAILEEAVSCGITVTVKETGFFSPEIFIWGTPDRDIVNKFWGKVDKLRLLLDNETTEQKTNEQATAADKAKKLVYGDRNLDYGSPLQDYQRTSAVWSGLLIHKLKPGEKIEPQEAVMMMAAMKLCREFTKHKEDNIVDAIGYNLCLEWIIKDIEKLQKNEKSA